MQLVFRDVETISIVAFIDVVSHLLEILEILGNKKEDSLSRLSTEKIKQNRSKTRCILPRNL